MPNVDDHGLEVLKKAARNLDVIPKKDYALQVILVKDESDAGKKFTPTIFNIEATADSTTTIPLPENHLAFILRARKNSRFKLAYSEEGIDNTFISVPLGGYWIENKKIDSSNIYVVTNRDTVLELITYS